MLSRIFPKQIDNTYLGHRIAIWLFVLIILAKLPMGVNSMINARVVVTAADGIPLDSYGAAGAQTVIALFSLWGLCTLLLALQSVLVLIRYRAMIPFMYLLLLTEQAGRKLLLLAHPIAKSGTPSVSYGINLTLLAMLLVGLFLSMYRSDRPKTETPIVNPGM